MQLDIHFKVTVTHYKHTERASRARLARIWLRVLTKLVPLAVVITALLKHHA